MPHPPNRLASVRIATWNINSIKPRMPHLLAWLERTGPDVLCLQETKSSDADFPHEELAEAGYASAHHGDGRWNGVAILSRVGLTDVRTGLSNQPEFQDQQEPRAIAATCAGLRVWSLYVPNGREVGHPHYEYKLAWLDALTETVREEHRPGLVLLGDFNVAPTDADVYDIEQFAESTHVTAAERVKLSDLAAAGLDEIAPRPLKYDVAFTFWDYRQLAFPKNRGMRIDLAFAAPDTAHRVKDAYVDREARKGKGTSDHAPVVIDLEEQS